MSGAGRCRDDLDTWLDNLPEAEQEQPAPEGERACVRCKCEYVRTDAMFTVNLNCECNCHKHDEWHADTDNSGNGFVWQGSALLGSVLIWICVLTPLLIAFAWICYPSLQGKGGLFPTRILNEFNGNGSAGIQASNFRPDAVNAFHNVLYGVSSVNGRCLKSSIPTPIVIPEPVYEPACVIAGNPILASATLLMGPNIETFQFARCTAKAILDAREYPSTPASSSYRIATSPLGFPFKAASNASKFRTRSRWCSLNSSNSRSAFAVSSSCLERFVFSTSISSFCLNASLVPMASVSPKTINEKNWSNVNNANHGSEANHETSRVIGNLFSLMFILAGLTLGIIVLIIAYRNTKSLDSKD